MSIFEDVRLPVSVNPTFGSGGGYFNRSGQGGGRVILHAQGVLKVYSSARIDAEGSPAISSYHGAGSGGSIAVQAYNLTLQGHLSVKGGNGDASLMSPAGGGGRIAISVSDIMQLLCFSHRFNGLPICDLFDSSLVLTLLM